MRSAICHLSKFFDELSEQTYAPSRCRLLRIVRNVRTRISHVSDIEVRPLRSLAHELLKEHRSFGSAVERSIARVSHVSILALEVIEKFFVKRKLPHALATLFGGCLDAAQKAWVIAHQTCCSFSH